MKGRFLTFEGIDGAGKSTHHAWAVDFLRSKGKTVVSTREPGGTPLGEKLRALLLAEPMHLETEALLMFAARREHIANVIAPALTAGNWVLCDRFTDASFAYQGGGRGLAKSKLRELEIWVQGELQPDLTFLFDLDVDVAGRRLAKTGQAKDRFELEEAEFHERVRRAYLERCREFPARFRVLDASMPLADIRERLEEIIATL